MKVTSQYALGPNPAKRVEIQIGNWDMTAAGSVDIDTGLGYSRWRYIEVIIRDDTGAIISDLEIDGEASGYWEHTAAKGATILSLYRGAGGRYNAAAYSNSPYNRGYVSIDYD